MKSKAKQREHKKKGKNSLIGLKCKWCEKIFREHTKRIYIPLSQRKNKGMEDSYKEIIVGKTYMLSFCSDQCRTDYNNHKKEARSINSELKKQVLLRWGEKCLLCGEKKNMEFHHLEPIWRGGKSTPENIVPLCKDCHKIITGFGNDRIKKWSVKKTSWGFENYVLNPRFLSVRNKMIKQLKALTATSTQNTK